MDYGMFSKAGNVAVDRIVNRILKLSITTTDRQLYDYLKNRMSQIETRHPEVYDTEVRSAIIGVLEQKLNRDLTMYF